MWLAPVLPFVLRRELRVPCPPSANRHTKTHLKMGVELILKQTSGLKAARKKRPKRRFGWVNGRELNGSG
jgi:hypothetical protein